MIIRPARSISGSIRVPGDKSISHRAAMLAAIADGETRITNFAPGEDCRSTLNVLRQLGVEIAENGCDLSISGVGIDGLRQPADPLDCGNSGTTMRLIAGLLAGQNFHSRLIGDASLSRRPMDRIAVPLRKMGASVETTDGHPPITIRGGDLNAICYDPPVASAQLKSCILLAGIYAEGTTSVNEPTPTRDHTEQLMRHFGIPIRLNGKRIEIDGGCRSTANDANIPGDPSSAAYFAAAAAIVAGSSVELQSVLANARRTAFFDLLEEIGCKITSKPAAEIFVEPAMDITVSYARPRSKPLVISGKRTVDLIDELPLVAVMGTTLPCGLVVRDAAELRLKESDRIAATVNDLRRMNAQIQEFDDGFAVAPSQLSGAAIETFADHRIAMAFAVAALVADGDTSIDDAKCVYVSYPQFFDSLKSVVR